ncbi:hypothetical protein [Kocuria atrinae]|nr:hypothetical protein [Kocuria atrinae]
MAILEVQDPAHQHDLADVAIPKGVEIRWVHRASQQPGERAS